MSDTAAVDLDGYEHLADLHEELTERISDYYPSPDHVGEQTPPTVVAASLLGVVHAAIASHVVDEVAALLPQITAADADRLARALHEADCGCGDYDEAEDPRYITAARAALAASPSPRGGEPQ